MKNLFRTLLAVALCAACSVAKPMNEWPVANRHGYNGQVHEGHIQTTRFGADYRSFLVSIYLPKNMPPGRRFPVLYALDGQQYFGDEGLNWGLDETLTRLMNEKAMQDIIVVAIHTANGKFRGDYFTAHATFSPDDNRNWLGKASVFYDFLMDVKHRVDAELPTIQDDNGLLGSSLGGLFTLYAGMKHPHTFQHVAVMSPALMVIHRNFQDEAGEPWVAVAPDHQWPKRLWLDIGDQEGNFPEQWDQFFQYGFDLDTWFHQQSGNMNNDYHFQPYQGNDTRRHDEFSWGERAKDMLPFLYPRS